MIIEIALGIVLGALLLTALAHIGDIIAVVIEIALPLLGAFALLGLAAFMILVALNDPRSPILVAIGALGFVTLASCGILAARDHVRALDSAQRRSLVVRWGSGSAVATLALVVLANLPEEALATLFLTALSLAFTVVGYRREVKMSRIARAFCSAIGGAGFAMLLIHWLIVVALEDPRNPTAREAQLVVIAIVAFVEGVRGWLRGRVHTTEPAIG